LAVSFYYEWDGNDDPFEGSDEAWVKGTWTSPTSGAHTLGQDLDSGHSNGDGSLEIACEENPDTEFSGLFYQDVTSWVEGVGGYYLDFGGKLDSSTSSEWGHFMFDNVSVSIYNQTGQTISMSFPGVNLSQVKSATLEYEALDIDPGRFDCIFMNGYHIGMADVQEINASSNWQPVKFDIPVMYLQSGENYIEFTGGTSRGCNRTGDNDAHEIRDVQMTLVHSNETHDYLRKKSMLIMSDGEANTLIGDCSNYDSSGCPAITGWDTPANETIRRACEAHDKYNITIYAVVFGNAGQDAEDMLYEAACCDNCSNFFTSNDADTLAEIYSRIASGIINTSFDAQTIQISQDVGAISTIYPDSYIEINYSSSIAPPQYGEITLNFETHTFETMSGVNLTTDNATMTKEGWFFVPSNVQLLSGRVTSYSSQYWSDRLFIKNSSTNWSRIYWLDDFGQENYTELGDPFVVDIPVEYMTSGDNNSIRIGTGFGPDNGTGGSPDSRVIYTGRISGLTLEGYSDVFPRAEGSTVTVYYDIDGDNVSDDSVTVQIGSNPSDIFDPMNDSIDNAFMRLLDMLNVIWDANPGDIGNGTSANPYDGGILAPENPIDFQITSDIQFDSQLSGGVPSMWGPSELEVQVWI
jgi:hypothetical protein